MPRPVSTERRYVGGLDGIRAVAVICVIAYHLNVPGAAGGMLGVGVFFTLSGYLITDILLTSWNRRGSMRLPQFWLHRARRLLPALFLMLVAVSVYVALLDAGQLSEVRRQVIAAALYVGNWSTIAQHGSYFARFAAPLPLDHLWSLGIEEQFYLVWPWMLLAGIWVLRTRAGLLLLTLATAAFSAWLMGHLYHPGLDPTRVYEGTDTRAFELLIGAALAMVWGSRAAERGLSPRRTLALDGAGLAGLIAILLLVWRTDVFSSFLYPTGFVLLAVATAALVAAVVNPASRLGGALGWTPLRWTGVRSYGIYLWQWPIIVLASPTVITFQWRRAGLEVAGTLLVAALSWRLVEDPIRRGALGRMWQRARTGATTGWVRARTVAVSGAVAAGVAVAAVGLSGGLPVASAGSGSAPVGGRLNRVQALTPTRTQTTSIKPVRSARPVRVPTRSSCRSVVYIGDSTSEGEISTDYIPNPRQRLAAQLARVGVRKLYPEISGARSIVETFEGHANAATVADQHVADGFGGCWILALGTNDVDNVNTGSTVGFSARINHMMAIIGRHPVLWVAAVTLLRSGPYSEPDMQRWNHALLAACKRHPAMRVFDWPFWAKPRWFIPDGIHYYSPGYVARARRISQGLAHAFPQGSPLSASCVVR